MKKLFRSCSKLPTTGWIGLFIFVIATIFLVRHQEPFYRWFYCFAWWSYILVIDAMNHVFEGESLLLDHPGEFAFVSFSSVGVWLIFEMYNIALKNWHYIQLPGNQAVRWFGYFIAYATVLPGLFETASFLKFTGVLKGWAYGKRWIYSSKWRIWFLVAGSISVIIPVVWPLYFFPLVWFGFFFLLEPINYMCGGYSFIKLGQKGDWRDLGLFLLAGLICGLLWESWNFWAGSKWIYTVPWVGKWKIFEMPVLGFLGFPPFAVETYVIMNTIFWVRDSIWEALNGNSSSVRLRTIIMVISFFIVALLLYFYAFDLIDKYTVLSFSK